MTEPVARGSKAVLSPSPSWLGYLMGPAFLVLAAWFVWGPEVADVPPAPTPGITPDSIDTAPRRSILGDPPVVHVNSFDRTCMECHRTFESTPRPAGGLLQHGHVKLKHAIDHTCDTCHHPKDRDKLTLRGGRAVDYTQVVEMCAQCHGPVWRDWERGAHGRTNGYWDPARGEPRRLKCTECHDPHAPRTPAMDPVRPLPGPNTLRMGDPTLTIPELHSKDPLIQALERPRKAADPVPVPPTVPDPKKTEEKR